MKSFELQSTTQKSYYQKAYILMDDYGNAFLKSYNTIVCGIINGSFHRYWFGYSATTMKHINDFLRCFNVSGGGKKWWQSLEVERY